MTRFLILRLLGFVYFWAFLSLAIQFQPLLGSDGLLPVEIFLERMEASTGGGVGNLWSWPTIFWLNHSDAFLQILAWAGVGLSIVLFSGYGSAVFLFVIWGLYLSFYHVGQLWYGYGWETQTLETTAIAIFLCPLICGSPFPRGQPPSRLVIWLFRWMAFRIMIGAGLIKIRGDASWMDLTALQYHFETQPIPNPASWFLHHLPGGVLKFGVLYNHIVELVLPWLILIPAEIFRLPSYLGEFVKRRWESRFSDSRWKSWEQFVGKLEPFHQAVFPILRILILIAGINMVGFQLFLIASGNLSFLNWVSIVPFLACFDDRFLQRFFPRRLKAAIVGKMDSPRRWETSRLAVAGVYFVLVAWLSVGPIRNLFFSERQIMNTSFNPWHLVNTYGAFGSVGKERYEIVIEGTLDAIPGDGANWEEYEFPGKPTQIDRRPPQIAPFQPRIDWQIWFAAMSRPEREPWLIHLIDKLLQGDRQAARLLAENPFPDGPPRWIRCGFYRYRFTTPEERRETGDWWFRERLGLWLRPFEVSDPILRRNFGPANSGAHSL